MHNIRQLIQQLQQTNEKAYYLAVLRVFTCTWLLKEVLLRWSAFEVIYSNKSFLNIPPDGLYFLRNHFFALKENYLVIIYIFIFLLLLNILGIGKNLVSLLVFLSFAILHAISNRFSNGGDQVALLLTFYLSAANTFSYFTLFKRKPLSERKEKLYNLLSNLAAYSIMLNLSFIYFMSALGKLEDPLWRKGEAIYYYLNGERFFAFGGNDHHIELPKIIVYILNYGTMLLELTAPFLIWIKRTRLIAFILLFLMHLGIYFFLMIYGMSVIFVIQYGLFFSEAEIKNALKKVKGIFLKKAPLSKNSNV